MNKRKTRQLVLGASAWLTLVTVTSCGPSASPAPQVPKPTPSDVIEVSSGAPPCDDPQVFDMLGEIWVDQNGVSEAMRVERISDTYEFRYDSARDRRYCNASVFYKGREVELVSRDGSREPYIQTETRIGYLIDNDPETDRFTVQTTADGFPYMDESISPSISVAMALAQRREVCERMLAEYAADPNNANTLWVLDEPGADCSRSNNP